MGVWHPITASWNLANRLRRMSNAISLTQLTPVSLTIREPQMTLANETKEFRQQTPHSSSIVLREYIRPHLENYV